MSNLKACTTVRHKWKFIENREVWRHGPNSSSMTLKGVYRCEHCKQAKFGNFQMLRTVEP